MISNNLGLKVVESHQSHLELYVVMFIITKNVVYFKIMLKYIIVNIDILLISFIIHSHGTVQNFGQVTYQKMDVLYQMLSR